MKKVATFTAILVFMILCIGPASTALSAEKDTRTFMFIGEPNAKAWQYLIDNPEERVAFSQKHFGMVQ